MNIKQLQRILNAAGAKLVPDGIAGPQTAQAIKNFQQAHGLASDGIAGPKTIGALQKAAYMPPLLATLPPVSGLAEAMQNAIEQFDLATPQRQAAFIAQCGHESADFKHLQENLNYSAEALLKVWPSHFDEANVADYANQPEKIANRAYANRMGNGDEASGDGWRYHGRGAIQLTGKTNYEKFGDVDNPDLQAQFPQAILSAGRFWKANKLNSYADKGDIEGMTKRINGGLNGLDDRLRRYHAALETLE